jgi:hypothetical protein
MPHLTSRSVAAAASVIWAGACGGSDASRGAGAETGATDSAAMAASAGPTELRISNVMIGKRVGAGNRIIEPTFQFTPQETVYVSVGTEGGSGGGSLTAAWRFQDGKILLKSSEPVPAAGENTQFSLSQPKGLKQGTYKVVLFLNEDSVDTKVFVVKK